MANIGGGGAGPSNQPVGGGDTSHGGFSNVDDDPLFTDADPDVLFTNIGGGGAGLSNQPGGGVDPVSGAFSGYLATDANFSVDHLLNNIGGGGRGGEVLLNQPGGGGDPVPGAFSEYLATDPNIGGGGSGAEVLLNQPGGGVDPVPGAFSEYLATDDNFSIDDVINNIGGGGAALSNQPGGGVDPLSGAFSDYLATDANFSIDDLTNNIGGGGGGAAGLSNQLRTGGDPSHGGFCNLDDDRIITEAAADTLITNIGGGGRGAGLSNQLGVGGDSLQGGFRNLDDTLITNIGGGGAGLSNQPGGGVDPVSGAFSGYLATDANFSVDHLLNTANIPELHGSYDRDPTLDPGYNSAVSYIKASVPYAGTSGTSEFQSPNVQGAKEYAGTSAKNVFQSPELREDFFDGINDMPYFNSTGVGEQVSGILETVPDTVHSFTHHAYSSSPNPVHPWYAIRTIPLGTTRSELASKELDDLQYRFINKRDFTSTFQKVFPHANISYMVSALPKYDRSRYADFGVPFAHLTGLFPMPCAYCPEIITQPVWKDVNLRAAAAFVATVAAEFAVVIRGWSRIYMSHNGLSLEQCTVLSRRALAMLYPEDPILGPDGLVSFHTAFAPYFRHLKSQVDIDRVPIPLPRGRLARFSFTQKQDPYARDSTLVGPAEIRDRHVRGSSVLASTSQSRDRNVRGRVQPSISQLSVRGRAKASTSLSSSSSHEASFLCLPHPSPKFVCPRYERISVPVEHLNAMFPHQSPYLPRGDPRSYAVFMELDHHRAASTFCAAAAADMCMIVDKWARMFGLPEGLPMEESYLLAREALGLLLPQHPAFGRQGLATFHTGLAPYYRCLHELQKRVPTPELFGDPGNPYYYNTLPDVYDASLPR